MNKYDNLKKELGKEVLGDEKLAKYTSFKIGGPADLFFRACNINDLIKAVKLAVKYKVPYVALGEGSNILVSDSGFCGLVIKNESKNLKIENSKVIASSGAKLINIVRHCAEKNLGGLEFLANIPGTIGGAVYGNAGSYKKDSKKYIADVFIEAKLLSDDGKTKKVKKDYFNFGYRTSKVKKTRELILEVTLKLKPKKKSDIIRSIKDDISQRVKKYPPYPFPGSFFKNPPGKYAGQLIDNAGFKGKKIGGAMVSEKHGNFIVNTGKAKADDVIVLARKIKEEVYNKFEIKLEEEIQYIGEF